MRRLVSIILCICFLFSPTACSRDKIDYTVLSEKAQTIADTLVNDFGSTSVQYAIIDNGEIIVSGGSGVFDKIENRAITRDDIFGIGSTSKMFVTAAAMTLVDKGLLDIDAPLTDYITEFKMADERYKDITPRMLMNHSSGIYGTCYADILLFNDPDTKAHDELLARLAEQRLKAAPGEMLIYCNDGFTLLELLVEHISGISYTEFLNKNFFKPLKLTHTKTPQDDFDRTLVVKSYNPLYDGALPCETFNALGTGGLYSTAEDLCRFAEVLMGNKPDILSEEFALQMRNDEYKKSIWQADLNEHMGCIGLGWDTVHCFPFGDYEIESAGKSGSTLLFNSFLVILPEHDIAMAVISSGGNAGADYPFISNSLQELLLQKGIIKQISPQRTCDAPIQTDMPAELSTYSGLYANTESQFDVQIKDGILTIANTDNTTKYIYIGNNTFKLEDGSSSIKIVHLSNDNVFLQTNSFPVIPGVGQLATCSLTAERISPVTVPETILNSWSERAGMKYYVVSEKPSSEIYFIDGMLCVNLYDDFSKGYAYAGIKIVNENLAVNTLKFRDLTDLVFFRQNDVEYLNSISLVYVREDFIPKLNSDMVSCAIDTNGYTKYFTIDSDTAGKTININMPQGAAYVVYDADNICIDFSTVTHNTKTVLPTNGKVGFIGKAGDNFTIALQ